jgi:MOSC domain-containing protein YiiM
MEMGRAILAGHGGEHRAVMVYQLDSYRFWEEFLQRRDFRVWPGSARI